MRLAVVQVADAVPEHDAVVARGWDKLLHRGFVDASDPLTLLFEDFGFIDGILGLVHELDLREVPFQQLVSDVTAAAGHLERPFLLHRREPFDHFLQLVDGWFVNQFHAVLLLLCGVFVDMLSVLSNKASFLFEYTLRLNFIFILILSINILGANLIILYCYFAFSYYLFYFLHQSLLLPILKGF